MIIYDFTLLVRLGTSIDEGDGILVELLGSVKNEFEGLRHG